MNISLNEAVKSKIDTGDACLDDERFADAIAAFSEAIDLIPTPKTVHPLSLDAYLALAECQYFSGYFQDALQTIRECKKCDGAMENPFLYLRLGQIAWECQQFDEAANALTSAYAIDGKAIFEGEDPKYLSFLRTQITVE